MVSLVALHLQDCYAHAEPVQRGVQALRQLLWEEGGSTHLQPTRAVVRDTATSVMGLYSGSKLRSEPRLQHTVEGLIDWQFPDLQVAALLRQPQTAPHALRARWSRRMHAAWHPLLQRRLRRWRGRVSWRSAAGWAASSQAPAPEVETTAEVLLAALQHAPQSSITQPVRRGIWWLLAAQARDGGWHACGGAAGPWQRMRGYASPTALAAPQVTAGALEALAMWQHRSLWRHLTPTQRWRICAGVPAPPVDVRCAICDRCRMRMVRGRAGRCDCMCSPQVRCFAVYGKPPWRVATPW